MGQKVHPGGFRVGVIHDWKSNWWTGKPEFADYLLEDVRIREHILGKLSHAGLSDILIRKDKQRITVDIYTARPGIVIGKSGVEVDALRKELHAITKKNVHININEIKRPELDAKLVAQSIANGRPEVGRVGAAVDGEITAIGEAGHQADQEPAPLPEALGRPTQDARNGVEAPAGLVHLGDDAAERQVPIPRHREGQGVVLPSLREGIGRDAPFRAHLVPELGPGQRREEQRVEVVDAVSGCGVCDTPADPRSVRVQSDDEGAHDQHAVTVDALHRRAEVSTPDEVELLAELPEPLRRRRLEPDEDSLAPGLGGQLQQLLVIGEVDRGLRNPLFAEVRLRHGAEQRLGAGDVLEARPDEIVVDQQDPLLRDALELPDDVRDGPLAVRGAIEGSHAAESAVQWTAAGGLNGAERVAPREQVVPGRADILDLGQPAVVPALQAAPPHILEDLRPDALGFPRHDRVDPLRHPAQRQLPQREEVAALEEVLPRELGLLPVAPGPPEARSPQSSGRPVPPYSPGDPAHRCHGKVSIAWTH